MLTSVHLICDDGVINHHHSTNSNTLYSAAHDVIKSMQLTSQPSCMGASRSALAIAFNTTMIIYSVRVHWLSSLHFFRMFAFLHAYKHTYIYTYIHTYAHTSGCQAIQSTGYTACHMHPEININPRDIENNISIIILHHRVCGGDGRWVAECERPDWVTGVRH